MKFLSISIIVFVMFLAILVLDYLWLGIITKNFIISQFGSLVKVENGSIKIHLLIGLLTWLIIAIGVFVFAVLPADTLTKAMLLGALFGFVTYAIYDLTNLTFLVNYPVPFVFVDIAWGTVLGSVLALVGFLLKDIF
jgi:uncharacterized membrane protein